MKKPTSREEWVEFADGEALEAITKHFYDRPRKIGQTDEELRLAARYDEFDMQEKQRSPIYSGDKEKSAEDILKEIIKLIRERVK